MYVYKYTSIILTVINFNYTCVYQLSLIRISQILYSRLTLKKLIINIYTFINVPIIEKKIILTYLQAIRKQ